MPRIGEVFDRTVAFQKERHADPDRHRGWSWCVSDLNTICGRIQMGWDIRISGPAKRGKTAFMISQARLAMQEGAFIFYNALEENDEQIMLRMITNAAGIERNRFRDLAMLDSDWERVERLRGEFYELKGIVEFGLTTIEAVHQALLMEPTVDIVFIDPMTNLTPGLRVQSLAEAYGLVSQQIRGLSLVARPKQPGDRHQPATVTAVHLNDDGNYLWTRGTGRDGDVILKMADVVDLSGRVVPNQVNIEVALSRQSGSGDLVKAYMNGALSLVGGLLEETVDINALARAWVLDQEKD